MQHYQLSSLTTYYVPEAGSLQSFKDYIATLPATDRPEAFGQHGNAEISYLIEDSRVVLDTLLALQPADTAGAGGGSREELVMGIATDLLEQIPEPFNLEQVGAGGCCWAGLPVRAAGGLAAAELASVIATTSRTQTVPKHLMG